MTKPLVHRFAHQAMGTFFEVTVAGEDESYAAQAAQAVFREIERIESLFSRFNPASEISRMNRLKPGESLLIGIETFECLTTAEKMREETRGAFDINVGSQFRVENPFPQASNHVRRSASASRTGHEILSSDQEGNSPLDSSRAAPTSIPSPPAATVNNTKIKNMISASSALSLKVPIGFPIKLTRASIGFEAKLEVPGDKVPATPAIDLGGIGKGYALDRALSVLADWSIENALIHAGTSTAIAIGSAPRNLPKNRLFQGTQNDKGTNSSMSPFALDQVRNRESNLEPFNDACSAKEGWPVGVGGGWPCPDAPREIWLSERAVSGSGTEVKGKHIIDPRTGGPAKGHIAAWASHPSATVADALSTAFMVMSSEEVEDYCRRHPDVWALVVRDYGDCRMYGRIDL